MSPDFPREPDPAFEITQPQGNLRPRQTQFSQALRHARRLVQMTVVRVDLGGLAVEQATSRCRNRHGERVI